MKTSGLERLYGWGILVILAGIVVHAPLSVWLGTFLPEYSLLIKSWKEIIMLALLALVCIIIARRRLWKELLSDWLLRLSLVYAALHLVVMVFLWQGATSTLAGIAIDLRYILFFVLVYLAVKIIPSLRRNIVLAATIGAAIVVGFATLQLFLPPDVLTHIGYGEETIAPYLTVDKNPDYIRVNSTLRGPNPLGAYSGIVLGAVTAALVKGKLVSQNRKVKYLVGVLAACALVALWISFSRSALVAGIITVVAVAFITLFKKASKKMWTATAVIALVLLGGLFAVRNTSFVSNVIFHENPNGGSEISSNEDHLSSLEYGLRQAMSEPLGVGVGSTGSASLFGENPAIVENQYLFIAHEVGLLGLALFLVLFALVMIRLWQKRDDWLSLGVFASGLGLAFIGLLLPVWADDTVSIVWWGLAATALATIGKEKPHGRKPSK